MSSVNVTWRHIRARSNLESLISESDLEWLISGEFLISSESDLDEFVLVAVVSPSDANDEGLESLVVVAVAVVSTCTITRLQAALLICTHAVLAHSL